MMKLAYGDTVGEKSDEGFGAILGRSVSRTAHAAESREVGGGIDIVGGNSSWSCGHAVVTDCSQEENGGKEGAEFHDSDLVLNVMDEGSSARFFSRVLLAYVLCPVARRCSSTLYRISGKGTRNAYGQSIEGNRRAAVSWGCRMCTL